jgi:hypothetical protein
MLKTWGHVVVVVVVVSLVVVVAGSWGCPHFEMGRNHLGPIPIYIGCGLLAKAV